jgi:DNA-binding transcriptional ArsR family regulator
MALFHPLPDPVVELIAQRFRALGEPIRIRLLERLHDGEASLSELVRLSDTTPQNVSKHLGVLLQNGIVARRKQGTASYYRIADEVVFALCEQVCGSMEDQVAELGDLIAAGSGRPPA